MMSINTRKRTLLSASLLLALGLASTTTHALSPPNIQTNIPWSSNFTGVSAIMAAYNNARRQEEIQLGLPVNKLGNLVLPAQATWDSMSDDAKALFIINAERKARAGMMVGVIGLPLAGVESHVDNVSKGYAQLLHDTDKTGHYQPSGDPNTDNPQKRLNAGVGSTCMEFMTRSENLAYFSASSTTPIGASSIPSPLERAIYAWIYDDASSTWGHREAALLQDTPLSQPSQAWGYKNNNGSSAHEGFLGFHVIGSTDYTPFGTPTYPYSYGVAVVMNVIDPVSDAAAANCAYTVTTRMEDLPSTTSVTNQPPKAVNDTATTTAGKAVTVNVLANDSDPDGDTLSVTANTNPTNGTVTRNGADFTYTPKAGFVGTDSFTYTISDGKGGTATGTVTITVNAAANQPPKAVNDTATTTAGKAVTVNVLANDSDPDSDTLSVTANTNPANGTVTRSGGNITYTPKAGFTGTDTFTYTISDGKGGTATGTVTITVNAAANQPPKAVNDTATTTAGKAVTVNVLANDSDPDGDTLSVTANTNPTNGTVTRSGGNITYMPKAGFTGTDTFTYTISDGKGGTAIGTVTITVNAVANNAPIANDDKETGYWNSSIFISVLDNDKDPDGDSLTITKVTKPKYGTVRIQGPILVYELKPASKYRGDDSFQYTIKDSKGATASATVTVTVLNRIAF